MICCLNPDCPTPLNRDGKKVCETCGMPLVLLLRNRFRVTRVLSDEGGFGRTYIAEDVDKLNESCVIKQFAPKMPGTWALSKAIELFAKEAQRLQELGEHPQIPVLLAYFEQDSYLYLVQQFIDGENLLKDLEIRLLDASEPLLYTELEIRTLLLDLLPVLKFIHEHKVIHRDIKPQNIIRRQIDGRICLIDFGSSKQLTANVQSRVGTSIGSHGYSPVEQIRDGIASPASDLFSLGATCFHLLTGISPFQVWSEHGYNWVNYWRKYLKYPLNEEIAKVVDKLLKKDIQERYQTADEVMIDLAHKPSYLAVAKPAEKLPPTPLPSSSKKYVKFKNLFVIGTAIVCLGLGDVWYQQLHHMEIKFSYSHLPANREEIFNPSKNLGKNFSLSTTIAGYADSILSVAISPNSQAIASNIGNDIKLVSLVEGKQISTFKGHTSKVNVVAISPNGETLASGSDDQTVKLWNLTTGKQITTFTGHTGSINTLAFSPDGQILASGSNDKTIKLWNLVTKKEIRTLVGHTSAIRSIAISPDGTTIASGSDDTTTKLWSITTGKQIRTITDHSDKVTTVAFSPDGTTLASGSDDKNIKIFNLTTGKEIRTLAGDSGKVTAVVFSPDSSTLLSSSDDKTIHLWNLATGKQFWALTGHKEAVLCLAMSPDGKTLVSGSRDRTIKIWQQDSNNN